MYKWTTAELTIPEADNRTATASSSLAIVIPSFFPRNQRSGVFSVRVGGQLNGDALAQYQGVVRTIGVDRIQGAFMTNVWFVLARLRHLLFALGGLYAHK